MSKNVKISEDSVEKVLPEVTKIQTQLTNGNKCYWVPEDEVPLGTLTVTQDGVYKASEDPNGPYYGYSQVTASGIGSISMGNLKELTVTENGIYDAANESGGPYIGYSKVTVNVPEDKQSHTSSGTVGKDDDGDPAIAVVNPETGEIEVEKLEHGLPTRIEITTLPDVLTYGVGAIIGFDGIEVTAYCADDTTFNTSATPNGVIPFDQLVFPVTVAPDEPAVVEEYVTADLDIDPVEKPICTYKYYENYEAIGTSRLAFITIQSGSALVCGGRTSTDKLRMDGWYDYNLDPMTYNEKTAYIIGISFSGTIDRDLWKKIAWILAYGDTTSYEGGFRVPVRWTIPGDSAILETDYGINIVNVAPSGTND